LYHFRSSVPPSIGPHLLSSSFHALESFGPLISRHVRSITLAPMSLDMPLVSYSAPTCMKVLLLTPWNVKSLLLRPRNLSCYNCVAKCFLLGPRRSSTGMASNTLWTLVLRKSTLDIPCASRCLGILVGLSGVLVAGCTCPTCGPRRSDTPCGDFITAYCCDISILSARLCLTTALSSGSLWLVTTTGTPAVLGLIRYFRHLRQHCCQ
jgi:hypothetical protein